MGDGNLSIAVTGPSGFLYQKSSALTSGYVSPGADGAVRRRRTARRVL